MNNELWFYVFIDFALFIIHNSSFNFFIILSSSNAFLSVLSMIQLKRGMHLRFNFFFKVLQNWLECFFNFASIFPDKLYGKTEMPTLALFRSGEQSTQQTVTSPLFKTISSLIRFANSPFSSSLIWIMRDMNLRFKIYDFRFMARQ